MSGVQCNNPKSNVIYCKYNHFSSQFTYFVCFSVFFNPNRSLGFLCVLNNDMKLYAMTIFAFSVAQNYELNAQGIPWLEIREL